MTITSNLERPEPNERPASQDRRAATADLSWMLWTAIGIGGIWVAVLLISLFAPDLVSGSEPGFGAGSAPWSCCSR
jgi:hypothetical protein